MATCLCDAFFDDAAKASVEVLEHLGVRVIFPRDQTCCGQPAFNAGDWEASRRVIRHTLRVFAGDQPIIIPSGSCASMVFHGMPLAFENDPAMTEAVASFRARTWEFCDYLVHGLGITSWPGRYPHRVAFHRSCHTRGTRSAEAALQLLGSIEGLELAAFGESEQCCGFGGTFSVAYPNISAAMGRLKLQHITASEPEVLAAVDQACLLHLGGILQREGSGSLPRLHLSQILRDSLSLAPAPLSEPPNAPPNHP